MRFFERVINLHVHSIASDGTGTPVSLATAAAKAGVDVVLVADHNVFQPEIEGWYGPVLLLSGQEVNAPDRENENHLLVFGATGPVSFTQETLQSTLEVIRETGGLAFLAHPFERSGRYSGEPEIPWTRWDVRDFHGLEIWNYMSEFKAHVTTLGRTLLFALMPKLAIRGPFAETLLKWDELTAKGRVYIVGGSDAHAQRYHLGPLQRTIFSYEHLFAGVNTHLLLDAPWSGKVSIDSQTVYRALGAGRAFVAYDALAPARGFRFLAEDASGIHLMGSTIRLRGTVEFYVYLPAKADLRLLLNGFPVRRLRGKTLRFKADMPGVYRVEAFRAYAGRARCWILSNPIWIE